MLQDKIKSNILFLRLFCILKYFAPSAQSYLPAQLKHTEIKLYQFTPSAPNWNVYINKSNVLYRVLHKMFTCQFMLH